MRTARGYQTGGKRCLAAAGDLDPVAREDADAVAPHLPRGVTERLVAAVEGDPEIAVPERLDDFAIELDLLFLLGDCRPLTGKGRR